MTLDIHSVYRGRTRRIARRWPRVTLAALAVFAAVVITVQAVVAAVTGASS
jgi:hypothetical protein